MAIKERLKLGEFDIQNHKRDKGLARDIHNKIESHLKAKGLGSYTHVAVEGYKIVVYADCYSQVLDHTNEVLRGFEAKHQVKGRLPLKYIPTPVEESSTANDFRGRYVGLQRQYQNQILKNSELEGNIKDFQSRLASTEAGLAQEKKERSELEEDYLNLLEQREQPRALRRSAKPAELETIIKENEESFLRVQDGIITNVFDQVSRELENRSFYETPEVEEAKKTLDKRDEYLKRYGKDSLDSLPEQARKLTEEEWDKALGIVSEYEQKMGKEGTLEFPIHLITTKKGALITLPLIPGSTNSVSEAFYTALGDYISQVQSKQGFNAYLIPIEKFSTLRITTRKGSMYDLKAGLEKAFHDIAYKANLNINIFVTSLDSSRVQEEGTGAKTLESFKSFVVSRIKELGYRSVIQFCEDKSFSRNTLNGLFSGHSKGSRGSKKRLAKALEVSQSELKL